jgi:hypothetical protein
MVSIEGTFTSYWKGKPAPGTPPAQPIAPTAPGMEGEAPPAMAEEPAMAEAPGMTEEPGTPEAPAMADGPAMGEAPAMTEEPAMGTEGARGPEGAPGEPAPASAPAPAGPPRLDEGKGVLVVLGDADTVSDDFSGVRRRDITGGATAFFNGINGFGMVPNVIDWLSGSDDLIALRARGAVSRKLSEIDTDAASRVKFWNYAGAPVAVLLAGLFVYFVRRYRS